MSVFNSALSCFRSSFVATSDISISQSSERVKRRSCRDLYGLRGCAGSDRLLLIHDGAAEDPGIAQVNLQLRGPRQGALDHLFRQWILDVLLQRAAQGTSPVAAVHQRLFEDVFRGVVVYPD